MTLLQHWATNWDDLLVGATAIGILGHMVNTFPTPQNKYGAWLLGSIQYIVGQRIAAMNTMKGEQSVITAVKNGTGDGK